MNLDVYELINLRMEQPDGLSHEHTGIGMAPTLDMGSTCMSGLAPCEAVQWYCVRELTLARGLLCLGPCQTATQGMKNDHKIRCN